VSIAGYYSYKYDIVKKQLYFGAVIYIESCYYYTNSVLFRESHLSKAGSMTLYY
jgi:hypothetical protein